MLSPVRHNTRAAIRQAKRSGLGIVVSKRMKDIQTDSFVQQRVAGRSWGEDTGYDNLNASMVMIGALLLMQPAMRRIVGSPQPLKLTRGRLLAAIPLVVGLFHLIPGEVNLR